MDVSGELGDWAKGVAPSLIYIIFIIVRGFMEVT